MRKFRVVFGMEDKNGRVENHTYCDLYIDLCGFGHTGIDAGRKDSWTRRDHREQVLRDEIAKIIAEIEVDA